MSAALSLPTHAQTPPGRYLSASPVLSLDEPSQMASMHGSGLQLLQTHSSLFYPFISVGDVIEVDFNVRSIKYDSEFLISITDADGSQWFGARRFQFRLDGELWIADPDGFGGVTWHKLSPEVRSTITIYGEVREVFKPVSKLRSAT